MSVGPECGSRCWGREAAVEVTCHACFLVHGAVQAAAEMAGSWCYFLVCMGVACKAEEGLCGCEPSVHESWFDVEELTVIVTCWN